MSQSSIRPNTIPELQGLIANLEGQRIIPCGGKTKLGSLKEDEKYLLADLRGLSGIVDYQPSDFTITLASGTPIRTVVDTLEKSNQFMPFDPPWIDQGSTVGGMVATGINGPSKLLWGGIRDFILAIEYVDGSGDLIHSGARVVKNTAGFDLSKFFVGSAGRFGVLTSVTLKVFPKPRGWKTLRLTSTSLNDGLEVMSRLALLPIDLAAIDMDPDGKLYLRLVGSDESLIATTKRILKLAERRATDWLDGDEESRFWESRRDRPLGITISDTDSTQLWRVTCTPSRILELEKHLGRTQSTRTYSHAGNSLWIASEDPSVQAELASICQILKLDAMMIKGSTPLWKLVGPQTERTYWERIQNGMDPKHRFPSVTG